MAPTVDLDYFVRLVNPAEGRLFNQKYAGKRYVVPPGGEAFVPTPAAILWLGHPDYMDIPGDKRRRYRTNELQRLCVKWGVYERHDKMSDQFPTVQMWSLDGERFITVVDDPEGKHLTPTVNSIQDQENLTKTIAQMQKQMDAMQMALREAQSKAMEEAKPEQFNSTPPTPTPGTLPPPPFVEELPPDVESQSGPTVDTPNRPRVGPPRVSI